MRAVRDEAYQLRVVANGLRNRFKTDAALLADSCNRVEGLIAEIESSLNGSSGPKEAHGHDEDSRHHLAEAV